MRRFRFHASGIPAVLMACASAIVMPPLPTAAQQATKDQPLKCETGPVTKDFGKTEWLVYSCSDKRSVVIVSKPDSPANPFYFMLFSASSGYEIFGEGNGDKAFTSAAYQELQKLTAPHIAALIAETAAAEN